MSFKGTVKNGVVVLPPEAQLADGTPVEVIADETRREENLVIPFGGCRVRASPAGLHDLVRVWRPPGCVPARIQRAESEFGAPALCRDPAQRRRSLRAGGLQSVVSLTFSAANQAEITGNGLVGFVGSKCKTGT